MTHRIKFATVSLHISAVLYVGLGLIFLAIGGNDPMIQEKVGSGFVTAMVALCAACAVGVEMVVRGLQRRKFWAWVAGLCIFGTYVCSLFLPLGAFGLWGLLAAGSRAEFGIGGSALMKNEPALQPGV